MGMGIEGAPYARSLQSCNDRSALSSKLGKFRKPKANSSVERATHTKARPSNPNDSVERRAFALNARIEDLLHAVTERASDRLKNERPEFSACTLKAATRLIPLIFGFLAMFAMVSATSTALLCLLTALPSAFRILIAVYQPAFPMRNSSLGFSATTDRELPVYTVIAALHREARVVDQLLSAIERLDYPAEKLDVVVIVEATDPETHAAITDRKHRLPITVVPAQPVGPFTKPKALNIALELARGSFVAVYDAEDRPEANQLRRALNAFRSEGDDLACVQARLCVDTKLTWLARYFTAEYAGHFDVFLSKLAALGLPLPLGGSSNHFRTAVLRQVGGWDPYNVTEDADLGMRLARFGYRSAVINSTTYEEAPTKVGRWLEQRSRWFKGWMQTFLVHMREPRRLFHELGPRSFAAFLFVVGGNALVALAHPVFLAGLIFRISSGDGDLFEVAACSASVLIGYTPSIYIAWRGLSYRGVPNKLRTLAWTPIHWLLLSAAAWRGALELVFAPSHWNKTEHGLDDCSITPFLVKLHLHIVDLERRGELPQIWIDATCSAVDRQRLPRVSV